MKILAIVVTYNGMPWIDRCFGSLCAEPGPLRVVAVDNGSTDGTPDAVRTRFPAVELVKAEQNLGFGQANNIGLRMALDEGADHAFLLNQDAWALPGTVAKLAAAAEAFPQFGVLSPMHLSGDGTSLDRRFSDFIIPALCPGLYADLSLGRTKPQPYPAAFVNAAAWLVTRNAIATVGGFSPSFFHYSEDRNYAARLRYHGLQIGVLADAWIHHDRSQRAESIHFKDRHLLLERNAMQRFADPAYARTPAGERRWMVRRMWSALASAKRAELKAAMEEYGVIRRMDLAGAAVHRAESRKKGPSFL